MNEISRSYFFDENFDLRSEEWGRGLEFTAANPLRIAAWLTRPAENFRADDILSKKRSDQDRFNSARWLIRVFCYHGPGLSEDLFGLTWQLFKSEWEWIAGSEGIRNLVLEVVSESPSESDGLIAMVREVMDAIRSDLFPLLMLRMLLVSNDNSPSKKPIHGLVHDTVSNPDQSVRDVSWLGIMLLAMDSPPEFSVYRRVQERLKEAGDSKSSYQLVAAVTAVLDEEVREQLEAPGDPEKAWCDGIILRFDTIDRHAPPYLPWLEFGSMLCNLTAVRFASEGKSLGRAAELVVRSLKLNPLNRGADENTAQLHEIASQVLDKTRGVPQSELTWEGKRLHEGAVKAEAVLKDYEAGAAGTVDPRRGDALERAFIERIGLDPFLDLDRLQANEFAGFWMESIMAGPDAFDADEFSNRACRDHPEMTRLNWASIREATDRAAIPDIALMTLLLPPVEPPSTETLSEQIRSRELPESARDIELPSQALFDRIWKRSPEAWLWRAAIAAGIVLLLAGWFVRHGKIQAEERRAALYGRFLDGYEQRDFEALERTGNEFVLAANSSTSDERAATVRELLGDVIAAREERERHLLFREFLTAYNESRDDLPSRAESYFDRAPSTDLERRDTVELLLDRWAVEQSVELTLGGRVKEAEALLASVTRITDAYSNGRK